MTVTASTIALAAWLAAALQPAERARRAHDLPFEQMMTLAGMPATRVSEMQCGGYGLWLAKRVPAVPGAPTPLEAERLAAEVARRVGADAGIAADSTRVFVNEYNREIDFRVARSQDGGATVIAEKMTQCAPLFKGARAAAGAADIAGLTPAGLPAAVNAGLAACHARYTIAARRSTGEEAQQYSARADRARMLALAGKSGPELARAEAALAEAVTDESRFYDPEGKDIRIRLLICLPLVGWPPAR